MEARRWSERSIRSAPIHLEQASSLSRCAVEISLCLESLDTLSRQARQLIEMSGYGCVDHE